MKICLTCEGISETDLLACSTCGTRLLATDAVHYPLRRGEEDSTHPLLGARIDGKFRVVNVLGKGGMGTVFRAIHEVSLVPVALKLLHPRYGLRQAYRDAFLAEARITNLAEPPDFGRLPRIEQPEHQLELNEAVG